MKAIDPQVLVYLNNVLKKELTAINQYFLHSRMYLNWGFARLAKHEYDESIDEMKHADDLIQRILFLEGLPNLQDLGKLYIGQNVKEALAADLRLEMEAIPLLREAIGHSEAKEDFVSRALFARILDAEEEHVDWLETQLGLVEQLGLENYLQAQMRTGDR